MAYKPKIPEAKKPEEAKAEPAKEAAEGVAKPAVETKPEYVSTEEFRQLNERITGTLDNITTRLENLANQDRVAADQRNAPSQTDVQDVSDDELDQAILNGEKPSKLVRKMVEAQAQRMLRDYVLPLQQVGTEAIASLNERVVVKDMKHYGLLKKEVDEQIKKLPANLRVSPQAVEIAYKLALADNIEKVVSVQVEETLRKKDVDETGTTQDSSGKRVSGTPKAEAKTFESTFGPEAIKALRSVGRDPEMFVRRMGYKSVEDYLAQAEAVFGEET